MAYVNIRKIAALLVASAVMFCSAEVQAQQVPLPYEVFFKLGAVTLAPNELRVLTQAAQSIQDLGPRQVVIVGYADAVGSEVKNLNISRRRAEYVFQRLQALGVPSNIMSLDWKGEFEPSVPSAPDATVPKNRRATITLAY